MQFNLQELYQPYSNLDDLYPPFSKDEIDALILDLPNDKAPSPNGFNWFFFKKAWNIIREDVYTLCKGFFHHQEDIKSINSSYITLIPKKDNLESVNNFRPISLLNSSMKIITKLLANRLQSKALQIVHKNHYGCC